MSTNLIEPLLKSKVRLQWKPMKEQNYDGELFGSRNQDSVSWNMKYRQLLLVIFLDATMHIYQRSCP